MVEGLQGGNHLAHGSVYLTHEQSRGRGQGSNAWHATPGDNLTLSLYLEPDHLSVERLFALNQFVSLALVQTLRGFLPPHLLPALAVKWPNDLYVGHRKIAGILIQNSLGGNGLQWSVIGIGLNVRESNFPPSLCERATSLRQLTGEAIDPADVLAALFDALADTYSLLEVDRSSELHRRYLAQLYRYGREANYRRTADASTFRGTITGVGPEGFLSIRLPGSRTERFAVREVEFLPD